MDRFFNSDNAVMRVLSKIFDIGWLSILYVMFCAPVVTVGAATTSLYYVSAKVLRRDRSYVWTEFWRSFKQNFVPATIMWIFVVLVYGILYFNLKVIGITDQESRYGGYLAGAYIALGLLVFFVVSYVFCVLSRFDMKVSKIFRFSLYLAFRHFLHTALMLVILLGAFAITYIGFTKGIPIVLLLVPAGASFLYTFPMEHVLKKYMPKTEPTYTEDGEEIVEWYNE